MELCTYTKGGIPIYTYKNDTLHSFHISLFLRAGSMYEEECESGITHFLEHILVRNVNKLYGGELYSTLDKYSLDFNASTYSEMVQFYMHGARENFTRGADIITALMSDITLSAKEVAAERKRVKAEIRESDERGSIASLSASVVFSGTPLARGILGNNKSIDKIGKEKLREYRKRVMTPDKLFFYITGSFTDSDLEYLVSLIDKERVYTKNEKELPHDNTAIVPEDFFSRGPTVNIKNESYTLLRFSFDVDMEKVNPRILDLLYDMLLSGYNSPFFVLMSEERGLFYDIQGSAEHFKNIGVFQFTYELREKNIYDAVALTVKILSDFKNTLYPPDSLMKAAYVMNVGLLYDDARECNFTLAYDNHIMSEGYKTLDERARAYESITPCEIKAAANEIFTPKNLSLYIKGAKRKIDIEKIKNILKEI